MRQQPRQTRNRVIQRRPPPRQRIPKPHQIPLNRIPRPRVKRLENVIKLHRHTRPRNPQRPPIRNHPRRRPLLNLHKLQPQHRPRTNRRRRIHRHTPIRLIQLQRQLRPHLTIRQLNRLHIRHQPHPKPTLPNIIPNHQIRPIRKNRLQLLRRHKRQTLIRVISQKHRHQHRQHRHRTHHHRIRKRRGGAAGGPGLDVSDTTPAQQRLVQVGSRLLGAPLLRCVPRPGWRRSSPRGRRA